MSDQQPLPTSTFKLSSGKSVVGIPAEGQSQSEIVDSIQPDFKLGLISASTPASTRYQGQETQRMHFSASRKLQFGADDSSSLHRLSSNSLGLSFSGASPRTPNQPSRKDLPFNSIAAHITATVAAIETNILDKIQDQIDACKGTHTEIIQVVARIPDDVNPIFASIVRESVKSSIAAEFSQILPQITHNISAQVDAAVKESLHTYMTHLPGKSTHSGPTLHIIGGTSQPQITTSGGTSQTSFDVTSPTTPDPHGRPIKSVKSKRRRSSQKTSASLRKRFRGDKHLPDNPVVSDSSTVVTSNFNGASTCLFCHESLLEGPLHYKNCKSFLKRKKDLLSNV